MRHVLETATPVEQALRPAWPQALGLSIQERANL